MQKRRWKRFRGKGQTNAVPLFNSTDHKCIGGADVPSTQQRRSP